MVSFSIVAIGGAFRSLLRRRVTPSATHPGVKYVPWNIFNSTVLENLRSSALMMVSRVNGQRLGNNAGAPPITTRTNNPPILIERGNISGFPFSIHRVERMKGSAYHREKLCCSEQSFGSLQ